jgi:hypothetical protein
MPDAVGDSGSLEDALAGRYEFTIGGVMSEAWDLVDGFKGSFWSAALVIGAIVIALNGGWGLIAFTLYGADPPLWTRIVGAVIGALLSPLSIGLKVIAVRRASGLPCPFSMAFVGLGNAPAIIGAALLMVLLTYLGFVLLFFPGLYFMVAYTMALVLLVFRDMPVWTALETSRKAITHSWFRVCGLLLIVLVLTVLSALPLGIPLIWTIPWAMLVGGVLYRRMFGVPAAAVE